MKKRLFSLACFGFLTTVGFSQTPNTESEDLQWTPVEQLSDEFEQTDGIDETKWFDDHPFWDGRVPSNFLKGNAFVEDGYLKLKSTLKQDPETVDDPFKDVWVNAAACVSKEKNALPGYYYETRMKASSLSMTSSYWFRVGQFSEIDVIEHIGNPSRENRQADLPFEYHANTHTYGRSEFYVNGVVNGELKPEFKPRPASYKMPERGRDTFHIFGFWWKSPEELIFYYNGERVMDITPSVPFNENLHMIFDTEVFPFAQAGVPSIGLPKKENLEDDTKNTMLVDWVRVYKLEPKDNTKAHVSLSSTFKEFDLKDDFILYTRYNALADQEVLAEVVDNSGTVIATNRITATTGFNEAEIQITFTDSPPAADDYTYRVSIVG